MKHHRAYHICSFLCCRCNPFPQTILNTFIPSSSFNIPATFCHGGRTGAKLLDILGVLHIGYFALCPQQCKNMLLCCCCCACPASPWTIRRLPSSAHPEPVAARKLLESDILNPNPGQNELMCRFQ